MISINVYDPRGEHTPCRCDNCDEVTPSGELVPCNDADLDAGSEVPAGRCPKCDCEALCYIVKEQATSDDQVLMAQIVEALDNVLTRYAKDMPAEDFTRRLALVTAGRKAYRKTLREDRNIMRHSADL